MLTPEEQSAEAEIKFEPIWSNGHRMFRMAGDLVQGGTGGITLGNQYPPIRLTDGMVAAGNGGATLEAFGAIRHDELQTVKHTIDVPYRNQKQSPQLPDSIRLDILCRQVV